MDPASTIEAMVTVFRVSWILSLIAAFFICPLLLKAIWGLLTHSVLAHLAEQGLVRPNLRYLAALKLELSIVIWGCIPVLLAVIAFFAFDGLSKPGYYGLTFGFYLALYGFPLLACYFVLVGAIWLQWAWRWAGRELFPGAVERGVLPNHFRYGSSALLMLTILGIYVLTNLPGILFKMAEDLSEALVP